MDAVILASELVLAIFVLAFYARVWFTKGNEELDRLLRDDDE